VVIALGVAGYALRLSQAVGEEAKLTQQQAQEQRESADLADMRRAVAEQQRLQSELRLSEAERSTAIARENLEALKQALRDNQLDAARVAQAAVLERERDALRLRAADLEQQVKIAETALNQARRDLQQRLRPIVILPRRVARSRD
jgi:hypothetical protein